MRAFALARLSSSQDKIRLAGRKQVYSMAWQTDCGKMNLTDGVLVRAFVMVHERLLAFS